MYDITKQGDFCYYAILEAGAFSASTRPACRYNEVILL